MYSARILDLVWILLLVLTLGGIAMGENAASGFWVSLLIAGITALKGRLVIDYFMELGGAHPAIRRLVRMWSLLIPALIVLVYLFGPQIAKLTRLTGG